MSYFYSMIRSIKLFKMRQTLLLITALAICQFVSAQKLPNQPATDTANASAPFMRYPTVPPFRLLKPERLRMKVKEPLLSDTNITIMCWMIDISTWYIPWLHSASA